MLNTSMVDWDHDSHCLGKIAHCYLPGVVDTAGIDVVVVSCSPAAVVIVVVFTSSVVNEGPVVTFVTVETKVVSPTSGIHQQIVNYKTEVHHKSSCV